jgi:hypothetical protein
VRSSYQSVALSATGGGGTGSSEERAATGLQILTESMAKTAAAAIGEAGEKATIRKIDHALLRHILREWGTRSYEFLLEDKNKAEQIARLRIYFGNQLGKGSQPQDAIQHVRCYLGSGGSTHALQFILTQQVDFLLTQGDDEDDEDEGDEDVDDDQDE